MSEEIDTRITPSFHPVNVRELDGYDDDTSTILSMTEGAFSEAYKKIGKVHDASEAARSDPTLTEAAALVKAQDYADKVFTEVARRFDGASNNLKTIIGSIEKDLSAPVESRASNSLSAEIRAYVAALPADQRMSFVQSAIKDSDTRTASAILGGPAYLSGLTHEMQGVLTRMFHEHHEPLKAKRLRAAKAGLDLIGERSGLIFKELEKAVGADPRKISQHRTAAARTAKAFAPDA